MPSHFLHDALKPGKEDSLYALLLTDTHASVEPPAGLRPVGPRCHDQATKMENARSPWVPPPFSRSNCARCSSRFLSASPSMKQVGVVGARQAAILQRIGQNPAMALLVSIRKQPEGAGLLRCRREDGSSTFQRQSSSQAVHFVYHDLTHLAVETVLRNLCGFFSLIAIGWDIEDTSGKGRRGRLPKDAILVEEIVGLFDQERSAPAGWSHAQFNSFSPSKLTIDEFNAIRSLRESLFRQWKEVPVGGDLEVPFPVPHGRRLNASSESS